MTAPADHRSACGLPGAVTAALLVFFAAVSCVRSAPPGPGSHPAGKRVQHPAGLMSAHGVTPESVAGPSPIAAEPGPEGFLIVSGHTSGWITPCGCPGSQAGGVARRAGVRTLLMQEFPGRPVLYVDQGGLLGLKEGVERRTTEALLQAMDRIGYEAAGVGMADLGRSLEEASFIERFLRVPRFSANIVRDDSGLPAFPPYRVLTIPGRGEGANGQPPIRIGLIGLVDDRYDLFGFGAGGVSLVVAPMKVALARWLPELRSKADLVVLFVEAHPATLAPLLSSFPGIDLAVAGEGTQFETKPITVGGVPLISLGNQGKYVAELRIHRKNGRPAITPFVHWLDERFPEDPGLSRFAESALDAINELTRRVAEADPSPHPPIAPIVGAEKCQGCHAKEYAVWKSSRHATATAVLVRLKRDFTVACVYCHVTGFDSDDGTFVNLHATPELANVQCEKCHGPAEAHLADPAAPYGKVADNGCTLCHTPATDPTFDQQKRWPIIAH